MASSSTPWEKQSQLGNAFEELPHPASASIEPWDIYINCDGADVTFNLATLIYEELDSMGFRVFRDVDAIEPGDSIQSLIQHAIKSAKLHIPILSPSYADSPSLLAKLSFMLKTGERIIPIFDYVYPDDLSRIKQGKGMYASAFSEHEKRGRYTSEKLDEWKSALHHCSFLAGYMVNSSSDEVTVLKNIVNFAFRNIKKVFRNMEKTPLVVAKHPVGLDELVQGFESVAREVKLKITGIVGTGGSGKTTLAKELFNRNFSRFERRSFVFDVRDAASRGALPDKQKELLKDLGVESLSFDTVEEGKAILANHLSSLRVLLVLDDVDHIDQLYALLPNRETLDSQSLVIITTQDLGVLITWGIFSIYKMPPLDWLHAEQLFCWYAFSQPSPPLEFKTMVQNFVFVCYGLPLPLKVLGAQLYVKSPDYWISLLHKVLILPGDIRNSLQLSYDALDEEEKEMFLDAACFLIGERIGTAIAVWDASGWSGLHGLQTLVNRCLVELVDDPDSDGESIIWIHNQLRDMGREIASKQLPYRIWSSEQITRWREHSSKGQLIRGIRNARAFVTFIEYMVQSMGISSKHSKRLKFSNELAILSVEGNNLTEKFASLSENLVWLRWESFPLRGLPAWLTLRNLRVLELHDANELEELWEIEENAPLLLRELIITGTWSASFQRFPSTISSLNSLKKVSLLGDVGKEFGIKGLPEEFCDLRSLEHLELRHCTLLSSLPARFGYLRSLRHLDLSSCKELRILPNSFKHLMQLEHLNLSYCDKLTLQRDILENIRNLQNLYLSGCLRLRHLPDQITDQGRLRVLRLQDTGLDVVPLNIGELSKLEVLTIGSPFLTSFPDSLGDLSSLRSLSIIDCIELKSLPEALGRLTHLEHLYIESSEVTSLPEGLKRLVNLQSLKISGCPVSKLDFESGSSALCNLRVIEISETCVVRISITEDCCPRLETLRISRNDDLKEIGTLPRTVENIELSECENLEPGEYEGRLAISVHKS